MIDAIWESKLDGHYTCAVMRTGDYRGQLTVVEDESKSLLLDEEVPLAYDAIFGPDMDDVSDWMSKCMEAVDKQR